MQGLGGPVIGGSRFLVCVPGAGPESDGCPQFMRFATFTGLTFLARRPRYSPACVRDDVKPRSRRGPGADAVGCLSSGVAARAPVVRIHSCGRLVVAGCRFSGIAVALPVSVTSNLAPVVVPGLTLLIVSLAL